LSGGAGEPTLIPVARHRKLVNDHRDARWPARADEEVDVLGRFRIAVIAVSVIACAGVALASGRPPGSPSGFDHAPSNGEIRDKLRQLCVGLVKDQDKLPDNIAGRRCGCYANGVVKAMTYAEADEMRATGKFSPSAAPKAKRYMLSCRVKT
jgi:hypothetical protein